MGFDPSVNHVVLWIIIMHGEGRFSDFPASTCANRKQSCPTTINDLLKLLLALSNSSRTSGPFTHRDRIEKPAAQQREKPVYDL